MAWTREYDVSRLRDSSSCLNLRIFRSNFECLANSSTCEIESCSFFSELISSIKWDDSWLIDAVNRTIWKKCTYLLHLILFKVKTCTLESWQDFSRTLLIQPKAQLWALINPTYLVFPWLTLRFSNEPTKIGHFQSSKSIFEVK